MTTKQHEQLKNDYHLYREEDDEFVKSWGPSPSVKVNDVRVCRGEIEPFFSMEFYAENVLR